MFVCFCFLSCPSDSQQLSSVSCANSSGGICPGWQPRDAPTGDVRRGLHSLQAASTGFGRYPAPIRSSAEPWAFHAGCFQDLESHFLYLVTGAGNFLAIQVASFPLIPPWVSLLRSFLIVSKAYIHVTHATTTTHSANPTPPLPNHPPNPTITHPPIHPLTHPTPPYPSPWSQAPRKSLLSSDSCRLCDLQHTPGHLCVSTQPLRCK